MTTEKQPGITARVENPKIMQLIFDVCATLVDDVMLRFSSNGVELSAMDSSHVGMLNVQLDPAFFTLFSCDLPLNWGIHMADINKIMKRAKATDALELKYDENEPDLLKVIIITGKRHRTFNCRTFTFTQDTNVEDIVKELARRSWDHDNLGAAWFSMDLNHMEEIVNDGLVVDDMVVITFDPENKRVRFTTGEENGTYTNSVDIRFDDTEVILAYKGETVETAQFSLPYIAFALKIKAGVSNTEFGFETDRPLSIMSKFAIKDKAAGRFTYILAPHVDPEAEADTDLSDEEILEAINEL